MIRSDDPCALETIDPVLGLMLLDVLVDLWVIFHGGPENTIYTQPIDHRIILLNIDSYALKFT
jgi:hypothetical protein